MNVIFKTIFGSNLYGTNTPTSDEDFKGIYIPAARDIILGRTKKVIQANEKLSAGLKNSTGDTDFEIFSYQEFIKLLLEGQTVALDMLFSPEFSKYPSCSNIGEIWTNRDKLLHRGTSAFVGYCQTQAAKYGLKGGRVAAMEAAVQFLENLPGEDKLEKHWTAIEVLVSTTEHMKIEVIEGPNNKMLPHWNVCDRKMGLTTKVGYATLVFKKVYDNYGHRAKLAQKNENIDWKALLHAVRVCEEAKELLLTGNITFPRPERELLLKIRKAELPYQQISEIIEQGIKDVEIAKEKSILPNEPDREFADNLVSNTYFHEIIKVY